MIVTRLLVVFMLISGSLFSQRTEIRIYENKIPVFQIDQRINFYWANMDKAKFLSLKKKNKIYKGEQPILIDSVIKFDMDSIIPISTEYDSWMYSLYKDYDRYQRDQSEKYFLSGKVNSLNLNVGEDITLDLKGHVNFEYYLGKYVICSFRFYDPRPIYGENIILDFLAVLNAYNNNISITGNSAPGLMESEFTLFVDKMTSFLKKYKGSPYITSIFYMVHSNLGKFRFINDPNSFFSIFFNELVNFKNLDHFLNADKFRNLAIRYLDLFKGMKEKNDAKQLIADCAQRSSLDHNSIVEICNQLISH